MIQTVKNFLYVGVPLLAFILVVGQIVITNTLAGMRNDIHDLDGEIASLADEHDILWQEVASASALTTIAQKAILSGFVPPAKSSIVSLGDTLSVAVHLPAQAGRPAGTPGQQTVR